MNKLTTFIDFFNFYPFMLKEIRHKNNTSKDLFLYLGIRDIDYNGEKQHKGKTSDKDEIIEKWAMLKALALISNKINERFKNLAMAFRYFDYDKSQILGLNKFVQGIDHLRIKVSFNYIKKIFEFLDKSGEGLITFEDFKLLDEDNWREQAE